MRHQIKLPNPNIQLVSELPIDIQNAIKVNSQSIIKVTITPNIAKQLLQLNINRKQGVLLD